MKEPVDRMKKQWEEAQCREGHHDLNTGFLWYTCKRKDCYHAQPVITTGCEGFGESACGHCYADHVQGNLFAMMAA